MVYMVFVVTPMERQMGIVQKIFYFHVPSAYAMYLGFAVCAVSSAIYLYTRDERWDAFSVAGAEVGALFCLAVLTTGPLWARKAWGVYWTWDPRLTTTFLSGMIFFAYLVLRSFGTLGDVERRFAAGLAILGAVTMPLIHFSVRLWRGTHPTVITGEGKGLDPLMLKTLILGFVLFTALAMLLIYLRARIEQLKQRLSILQTEAAECGLLEDE